MRYCSTHPVGTLDVFNVQDPLPFLLVGYQKDPIIGCYYIGIYAEYCFRFLFQPGDLLIRLAEIFL